MAADILGFGNSDPLPAKITMEGLALNAVHVLDALGLERAHVFGFHTGNKIAAAMAAHYPDRVGRVVLMGMTHSLVVSRKERDAAIMHIVKKYMTAYRASPDGAHLARKWAADYGSLADIWWDPAVIGARTVTEAKLRRQEACMIELVQSRHSIKPIYQMNFGFDLAATVRRVKTPTLVIECRVPQETHLGEQGPKMIKLLKRGELLTLKGAGFDATEAFAAELAKATTRFLLQ